MGFYIFIYNFWFLLLFWLGINNRVFFVKKSVVIKILYMCISERVCVCVYMCIDIYYYFFLIIFDNVINSF